VNKACSFIMSNHSSPGALEYNLFPSPGLPASSTRQERGMFGGVVRSPRLVDCFMREEVSLPEALQADECGKQRRRGPLLA